MINVPHSPLLCDIAAHSIATPDKTALVVGERRISYAQLAANIEKAAALLQSLEVKQGDRVLLAAQKELEFVYLYFASHLLGVVNVVVDSSAPRDRLDYIINVVHPVVVFGIDSNDNNLPSVPYTQLCFEEGDGHYPLTLPHVKTSDVADVMFTTGTTGAPKGVCLSHANIAGSATNTNAFIATCSDDVEALALPLSHSFGLGRLRCVLSIGATLVFVSNFANLKSFFSILESEHVTGFGMVPAVWQYIKRFSGKRISRFSEQLRYIEIGSAPLPIEDKQMLIELFPDTRLCMHYGLTEASRAMFSEFHTNVSNLQTIGRPVTDKVEARVLDEAGNPVADDEDGELCVRGNMVIASYYLEQDNVNAFFDDWFRTGDWGHRDSNGYFYLTGRKKELINVGGEKVCPSTIEDAIKSLGVADCACIAIPDPHGVLGEVPKAFLQRGASEIDIDDLKQRLSSLLPPHEIPVQWEWIDQIPRTSSGKIQRLKLKQ